MRRKRSDIEVLERLRNIFVNGSSARREKIIHSMKDLLQTEVCKTYPDIREFWEGMIEFYTNLKNSLEAPKND